MDAECSFTAAGFSRWVVTACVFFLGLLAAGCRNTPIDSQMDAPQSTPASVYADSIGSARFERSAVKVEQGYTVESGNLYSRDGDAGSLVVVRSPDGAVVGIINEPGKHGLLKVDPQGRRTFIAEPAGDLLENDTVKPQEDIGRQATVSGGHSYIDMLFAYSANALNQLDVDPIAYALAQVEMVNLSLRSSRISEVSLRLSAVNVFDVLHNTSSVGLASWQSLLGPYRDQYKTDVNAAISAGTNQEQGRAYFRGYTSVSAWFAPTTFAHEIGHNVGGEHCEEANGSDYNYGYNNGRTKTNLCTGSRSLYYSTPAVNDSHGLPIGNARTADMARVWRESAPLFSSFKPELPGLRMMIASHPGNTYGQAAAGLSIPGGESQNVAIVALSQEVGPVRLVANGLGSSALLSVKLLNAEGRDVTVRLRASRLKETCKSPMNVYGACAGPFPTIFRLEYDSTDAGNANLSPGYYNGLLVLEAQSPDSDWKMPINVAVSLRK